MHQGNEASAWVRRFAGLVAAGAPVLDVACGGGRHLRLFHEAGHPVTGLDRDIAALGSLSTAPGVSAISCDLEGGLAAGGGWPLPPDARFAGVVVTNYLFRPLWPRLAAALAPGGVLIYETFAVGNARFGRPANPDFLLRPGELLEVAAAHNLTVVAFEQGRLDRPRPAVVQRLCAVRPVAAGSGGGDDLILFGLDPVGMDGQGGNP